MAVRIAEIKVESVGPLHSFTMTPAALNLIYGHNECGKTYLVEFLIRSLFKNTSSWELRDIAAARGQVQVAGLGKEPVPFSLAGKKRKLEDYLHDANPNLPANLPRLLVVRGADLEIVHGANRISDRTVLRDYLSGAETLDGIERNIKPTVRNATIGNGTIVASRTGEVKEREQALERIKTADNLLARINSDFSGGQAGVLNAQVAAVRVEITGQERAKRQYAYSLQETIKQLEAQRDALPKPELDSLAANLRDYDRKTIAFSEKEADWHAKQDRTQHYLWVKQAAETYQNATRDGPLHVSPALAIVALALVILGGILAFAVPALSPVFLILAVVLIYLYIRKMRKLVVQARDAFDAEGVGKEFVERFGRPFTGSAVLREQEELLSGEYHQADLLRKQLDTEQQELSQLRREISECLQRLAHVEVEQAGWQAKAGELTAKREELDGEITKQRLNLAALGVDAADCICEPTGETYDPAILQRALETEQKLLRQTEDETRALRGLQQEICNLTHDHIDTSWEKLIDHLRLQRADAVKDYKRVTAAILAGNMVGQVLGEMRAAEDGRIQAGLDSGIVGAPLAAITGRYRRVRLDGENLKVANDYEEFALADLSTGTQEQVLLALRIGLASYSAGEDRLFLILDDAFQHSDWGRRVHLVDATIGLAHNGWQVFYFTMDDHIRDLFCEKAGAALGGNFNYQELPRGRDWDALP